MNLLLIGSDDVTPDLLEQLQSSMEVSVFLAGSFYDASDLVHQYSFRFVVLVTNEITLLSDLNDLVISAPNSTVFVCGLEPPSGEHAPSPSKIIWLPNVEMLISVLKLYDETLSDLAREVESGTKPTHPRRSSDFISKQIQRS